MRNRTFLTGFATLLVALQACGSDDGKKKSMPEEAGMGGEAGTPEPASGGSSAGEPEPSDGGPGGEPSLGGSGGQDAAGMAGDPVLAGAGGEPSVPDPELLFSVKPGAIGLPLSAIDNAENPQNNIYTSRTGSQQLIDGQNAVKISGVELGLAPTDQIVAFALVQAAPKNPLYLFTIADNVQGAYPSRTYFDYWNDGDEQANLYYSDGVTSYRYLGEGGDEWGYNGLLATETSLGLSRAGETISDDLTGLVARDAREPITEVYFTVMPDALGVEGSSVAGMSAAERGCTVFKSSLDGKNSIAFGCADLDLIADDRIDGLALLSGEQLTVLFSVSAASLGDEGSAVQLTASNTDDVGATLFSSTGNGANELFLEAKNLGLDDSEFDEIDGFTVVDAAQPHVEHSGSCTLDPDLFAAAPGGDLQYVLSVSHVGNVMLVWGYSNQETTRVLAYDSSTCAGLGQQDLPDLFGNAPLAATLPLPGWSAAKPLEKVEYLRVVDNDLATAKVVRRYDAAGVAQSDVPISSIEVGHYVGTLVADPVHQRLFVFSPGGADSRVDVLPIPAADATQVESVAIQLTAPCADAEAIAGTDAAGNLVLARQQSDSYTYRVCRFTPFGELLPTPYFWTGESGSFQGFIEPGGSHVWLDPNDGSADIERGAFTTP